jgi:hypothetical protein
VPELGSLGTVRGALGNERPYREWLNPTPQTITVYASPWSSPSTTQHSLPGGRYPFTGPDFHRLDRASFAWRTATAIKAGFTINLSADNPAHADRLAELGIAPVVTVLARDYARRAIRHRFKRRPDQWAETIGEWRDRTACLSRHTTAGRRIAVCPATYSDATCKTCGACARVRDAVIGFPAHGAWRRVESATAAREVPAGQSWVFRDHRTMAEVIAEEAA